MLTKQPVLVENFPGKCFSISILKTKYPSSVKENQRFRGVQTKVVWTRDEVRFPCLKLPEEIVLWYAEQAPESVRQMVLNPNSQKTILDTNRQ